MRISDEDLQAALEELGVTLLELQAVRAPGPMSVMKSRLEEFQARVKKAYREAAMRLHPDRNPDNPEAEDKFKLVSEVSRQIQALQVRVVSNYRTTATTTTWTTNTAGGTIRINVKVHK